MADASDDSACKQVQEGEKPLRSCYLCRREDCEVWQDILEGIDDGEQDLTRSETVTKARPHGEVLADGGGGKLTALLGRTFHGEITMDAEELQKDVRRPAKSHKGILK